MNVFDRGSFNARARQDRLSSPYHSFNSASQTKAASAYKNNDWKEGFADGYQAALDRYIPADKG